MPERYLVVSDLHLCDVEEHPDGWKSYKSARYGIDDTLAALFERTAERAGEGDRLTLVLNGDVFDFDLFWAVPDDPPWPVKRSERKRGLEPTEEKSAWKLEQILAHHATFLDGLVRWLAAGHRVVYVLGNHDRELHYPAVRAVLRRALRDRAAERGVRIPEDPIRIEEWFYFEPGRIYAEHGHQYDWYSSYRFILDPVYQQKDRRLLVIPMGDLSGRNLMNALGFFNPHASDFILNAFAYVAHWLRHYAFSRRSLVFNWLWGSVVTLWALLKRKKQSRRRPEGYDRRMAAVAARHGLDPERIRALEGLRRAPITSTFFRVIREFWMDRVLIALLMTGGTIALALVPIPLWIKLMVPLSSFPLLYFIYEWAVRGETIFTVDSELPGYARAISRLLPAPVVTFGHTHKPRLIPLGNGTTFVDSGTWAPIWDRMDDRRLSPGYRNFISIRFEGAECRVELGSL